MMNTPSRILIVDDEETIRFAFEMILRGEGYEVCSAEDYDTALDGIKGFSPDLVITDIILKGKTGIDILVQVKAMGFRCPVIMITGEPSIETAAEAVRLGALDYILKPIRKKALLAKVAMGLRHKAILDKKTFLEEENVRVRQNMEAVFSSLQEGLLCVDGRMNVIGLNPALEKICRLMGEGLSGKSLRGIAMECSAQCLGILERTLATGRPVNEVQIQCGHKKKPGQMVRLTGAPLPAGEGAVLVVSNITRLQSLEDELNGRRRFHKVIGKNKRLQAIYTLIENLSDMDSTVLITGETGTGKEMIADAIHHNSSRRKGPYIKVNCSALSENLLESELFGHVKGAFTGAISDKKGRFEAADQGTLFLDEIGELSPVVQVKLLRVLQEKAFERVGGNTTLNTDVRIIAAAGSDFKQKVRQGAFRRDLYYRIKVVDIHLPPLRERRDDIPMLANHFLSLFNSRFSRQIRDLSTQVMAIFMGYAWPGNIRELEHAVEHAFVLCQGKTIHPAHLPGEIWQTPGGKTPKNASGIEREMILDMLEKTDWNKAKTARNLGIGRRTLYRKIAKFKISVPE